MLQKNVYFNLLNGDLYVVKSVDVNSSIEIYPRKYKTDSSSKQVISNGSISSNISKFY